MTDLDILRIEPTSFLAGLIIGSIAGLIVGWLIWQRNDSHSGAMQDLRWTQIIGAAMAAVALIISAPESVTIAFIALIPAENVALGIAGKGGAK